MAIEYYTELKASTKIFGDILKSGELKPFHGEVESVTNGTIIFWTNRITEHKNLINLSKKFPEETLHVRVATDDVFYNYVSVYEYKAGESFFIKEELEYLFTCITGNVHLIDPELYQEFINQAAEFYQRVDLVPQTKEIEGRVNTIDINKGDRHSSTSVYLEYKDKNVKVKATRYGLTNIEIEIEPVDEKK